MEFFPSQPAEPKKQFSDWPQVPLSLLVIHLLYSQPTSPKEPSAVQPLERRHQLLMVMEFVPSQTVEPKKQFSDWPQVPLSLLVIHLLYSQLTSPKEPFAV
jgi:hypothetical protein